MPKVGNKHFSYTKKGKEEAKRYAARTGRSVGGMRTRSTMSPSKRKK